jgi:hypothetical protein
MRRSPGIPAMRLSLRCKKAAAGVLGASALLLGAGSVLGWSAVAATPGPSLALTAASAPAVTLTGSVPALLGGSATVTVEAQLSQNRDARGVPQELEDAAVATAAITSPQFSIPVPASATLTQAEHEGSGIVQFEVILTSGTSATSVGFSAPLTAPTAVLNSAQRAAESSRIDQIPPFPPFMAAPRAQAAARTASRALAAGPDAVSGISPIGCIWQVYGAQFDKLTKIGEVHVANAAGLSDDFEYTNQNDQTISWIISSGPKSGFTADGTMLLTTSLSANGGQTFGRGVTAYVYTTEFYQEYRGAGWACRNDSGIAYKVLPVGTDSNVERGSGMPTGNPYGGCEHDPLGFPLQRSSHWDSDHAKAEQYSSAVTIFGTGLTDTVGFSSDIYQNYVAAPGAATTYICGAPRVQAANTPIIYNTTG